MRVRAGVFVAFCACTVAVWASPPPDDAANATLRDYLSANGLLNRGLFDLAAADYRKFLAASGDHEKAPVARYGLAVCLFRTDKTDEAITELEKLRAQFAEKKPASKADFPYTAEVGTMLGQCLLAKKRYADAIAPFDEVVRVAPRHDLASTAAAGLVEATALADRHDETIKRAEAFIARWPDDPRRPRVEHFQGRAWLLRGRSDLDADRLDAALKCFEAVRDIPGAKAFTPEALQLAALCEYRAKRYDRGRELCLNFLKEFEANEESAAARFLLAECEYLAGREAAAIDAYREFLKRHAGDAQAPIARFRLGMALYRAEKFDEAEPLLKQSRDLTGDSADFAKAAATALGDLYFRRGDWKSAEGLLAGGNGDAPPDALLQLALAQQRQEKFDDVLKTCERILAVTAGAKPADPIRLQAGFERGQALLALKQTSAAVDVFEQVLKDGPDSRFAPYATDHLAAILSQRGADQMAAGEFAAAEKTFADVLERFSTNPAASVARKQVAIAMARQDRFDDALKAIERAERDTPTPDATLLYEKAWCLRKLGRESDAADAYRRLADDSAERDTASKSLGTHALLELAAIESGAKRAEQAEKVLERLRDRLAADGNDLSSEVAEQAAYRLAMCKFELQKFGEAADLLDAFIAKFPSSSVANSAAYFCGEAYFRSQRVERAIPHLERVVKNGRAHGKSSSGGAKPDPDGGASAELPGALLRLGECLATSQRWPASEQAFADYLERFSAGEQWYQAEFGLGWARENQNRHDEAIKSYRRVIDRHKGPTAARAQFQIGECLFAQKKYEDAARELLKVDILYAYPEWSAAALFEAGRCFEQWGKMSEARVQYQAVVDKHKETRWAGLAAGKLAEKSAVALPGRSVEKRQP